MTTSICATTRRGPTRALVSRGRLPPWLVVERDTRTHAIMSVALARRRRRRSRADALGRNKLTGLPPARAAASSTARARCRSPSTASAIAAIPATRWPRRCWRTACASSAARSSITARAASSPRAPRSRTRWWSCAAARAASPTRARPSPSCIDGLVAASQNRWPSLRFDLLAVNSLLAPFFAAGFYYKTFMWPAAFWEKLYEPLIRRAAGLGRASLEPDPDRYEKAFAHCDVLVIGGGPGGADGGAGGGARRRARHPGEEDFRLGGRLLAETLTIGGEPAAGLGRERRCRAVGAAQRAPHAAHHRVRRLRRAPTARSSASTITSRRRRRTSRASAAGASSPSVRCWPPARIERPHGVRRQRPARHHAGVRRAHLSQSLRRRSGPARRRASPPATTAGARRPTWRAPASASRPSSIRARTRDSVAAAPLARHCRRHGREGARRHRSCAE